MTKLEQKLLELGYVEYDFCYTKKFNNELYINIYIKEDKIKKHIIFNVENFETQQDIDNLQQAYNQLQHDLEVLRGNMKKKIKDLTREEVGKICRKFETNCEKCPLYVDRYYCKNHDEVINKYGEEEIEVEQDEKLD